MNPASSWQYSSWPSAEEEKASFSADAPSWWMQEPTARNSTLPPCQISSLETPVMPTPPLRSASWVMRSNARSRPSWMTCVTGVTSPPAIVCSPALSVPTNPIE